MNGITIGEKIDPVVKEPQNVFPSDNHDATAVLYIIGINGGGSVRHHRLFRLP